MLKGEPAYYSRYANGIQLYMPPDRIYPVYINGTTRFAPLVNDSDTNPYLDEGEQLIRALAKAYLLEDVIRDLQAADLHVVDRVVVPRQRRGVARSSRDRAGLDRWPDDGGGPRRRRGRGRRTPPCTRGC